MSAHKRPNGRPVHPQCAASHLSGWSCTCGALWEYWDGTTESLDKRILRERRIEARCRPRVHSRTEIYEEAEDDQLESSGFWSNAEFLKTTRDST